MYTAVQHFCWFISDNHVLDMAVIRRTFRFISAQVFADASGFPVTAPQNAKIRQVMTMYRLFHDLALDLRSTTGDLKRAKSFRSRVLHFLNPAQNVGLRDCIHKVT